ncbi:beta-N-acetylhexosaminidase [Aureibacter tunicatorum]|uniref:Hexosaminidase n=1 Tax=Aureibacter tunicatorum TaxID=866807 RepID=A0AAE4BS89_9BACT|nr:family 20 glycosylhydrolase [Aureibacter tunicatorum]MDR6238618.1 hexosaminidase [Aureibacter tunicatorum]BDD05451.1 hypothetical protein AUTU_29340 [Aureibacter tunicatorum]
MKKAIIIFLMVFGFQSILNAQELALMPLPQSLEINEGKFRIDRNFNIQIEGLENERLINGSYRFLRRLDDRTGFFFYQNNDFKVDTASSLVIQAQREGELKIHEDESYTLLIDTLGISINAPTDLGAMYALETLVQTLSVDEDGYYFPAMKIEDSPRFTWRGLMLDPARHFLSVSAVKKQLDAMASMKMNVMHFHLSDNQGFRIESKLYPQLHQLGSSRGEFYTQDDIKDIVAYAALRGIRVIPEIDVPGHATPILKVFPEIGSHTGDYEYVLETWSGVFDPTLDPTNEKTYEILKDIFTEVSALFPDEYFHIGGDENEGHHWDANENIQAFMKQNGLEDNSALQTYFSNRVLEIVEGMGKKMVGWDEIYNPKLSKKAIVHGWRDWEGLDVYAAAKDGYEMIISEGYYIDLMHNADVHYLVDPVDPELSPKAKELIIGAEAPMWSELVTEFNIDSRIWPRTAAIAERFWSAEDVRDVEDMYRRLDRVSLYLEQDGLAHNSSRESIMKSLSNGEDIAPLRNLVNVAEPMKVYTRNPGGKMNHNYYTFKKFADAATADAPDARKFNYLVKDYMKTGDAIAEKEIRSYLKTWEANHEQLLPVIQQSPILGEIKELSENLSIVSQYAIESLNGVNKTDSWKRKASLAVANARKQGGRTELAMVDSLELLINK